MATKLHRRVVRETTYYHHRRPSKPIMVCLEEGGKLIRLWVKGERTKYAVTVEAVYQLGARIMHEEKKAEKKRLREEKQKRK